MDPGDCSRGEPGFDASARFTGYRMSWSRYENLDQTLKKTGSIRPRINFFNIIVAVIIIATASISRSMARYLSPADIAGLH